MALVRVGPLKAGPAEFEFWWSRPVASVLGASPEDMVSHPKHLY